MIVKFNYSVQIFFLNITFCHKSQIFIFKKYMHNIYLDKYIHIFFFFLHTFIDIIYFYVTHIKYKFLQFCPDSIKCHASIVCTSCTYEFYS